MAHIIIGADHAGFSLKEKLKTHLQNQGHTVEDIGTHNEDSVDYPNIAKTLAETFKAKKADWGVLCCGSGIGVCITANRFPWLRAVVLNDHHTATMSRRHNDANMACFGGRVLAPEFACDLLDTFIATEFDGGRHQRRVDQMTDAGTPNPEGAPSC